MTATKSERRLVENEAYFREQNEYFQKKLDETRKLAADNKQEPFEDAVAQPLHFFCECADENCLHRIQLTLDEYNKIHQRRDAFIIEPGHEVPDIERIVSKQKRFYVVKKHFKAPEHAPQLQSTPIHNV